MLRLYPTWPVLLKIQHFWDVTPRHCGPTWKERDCFIFIGWGACVYVCVCVYMSVCVCVCEYVCVSVCVCVCEYFFRYDWKVLTDLSASPAFLMASTHQQC